MQFHIGDILSTYSGTLCAPNGLDGVRGVLKFMTQAEATPHTHQIPRLLEEVAPYLREQLPWLSDVREEDLAIPQDLPTREAKFDASMARVMALAAIHGETHDLKPMHLEDHVEIDPVTEMKQQMGDRPVFTFPLEGDASNE